MGKRQCRIINQLHKCGVVSRFHTLACTILAEERGDWLANGEGIRPAGQVEDFT